MIESLTSTGYEILFQKLKEGVDEQSRFFQGVPDLLEADSAMDALVQRSAEIMDEGFCDTLTLS